jgi:quinoprotein glucose dehydrogenase
MQKSGIQVSGIVALLAITLTSGCSDVDVDSEHVADKLALARTQAAPAEQEWRHYLGDKSSSQYSPLTRIHRGNVAQLQLAWRYDSSGNVESLQGESQHNPLVVKGVLYGSAASAGRLFALNAATGEEIWTFTPPQATTQVTRGLLYWSDASGEDERILFGAGPYIHALDARTGQPVESFGDAGRINLQLQLRDESTEFDFLAATTPGVIYQDLLIQGMRVNEFSGAAPGHIRAYDVRTGALRWRFNTIPRRGEFGADTWPEAALEKVGGANAWAGMALDEKRGLVFIPTGSAAFDFYGADRAGDNLFANTLLALDAATGKRVWHYQVVRHDLWDRDLPSPPNLVTLNIGGQTVDAVVQATKSGHLFVFNRETGEPLFPIREEPFTAQGLTSAGLDRRDPALHANAIQRLATHQHEGIYNLPSLQGSILKPGFDGGAEWGGAAWDQAQGLLYINASELASILQLVPTEGDTLMEAMTSEIVYRMSCGQCHGADRRGGGIVASLRGIGSRMTPWELYDVIRNGRGRMPAIDHRVGALGSLAVMWHLYTAGDSEPGTAINSAATNYINTGYPDFVGGDNLPASAPPWGTLNAVDLNTGRIRWRIPLGDYPQALERGIQGKGAANYGGPVATAGGLLFIAATPDAKFRAFDSTTGELLWETDLPTGGFATPAVYESAGKQFVVISASGTKLGNAPGRYYLAFSLP